MIIGVFIKLINLNIAKQFEKRCNFSHCFGAMEGKHFAKQKRAGSSRFHIQEYLINLSLAVANDQITSVCTQILMQAVMMVVYTTVKFIRM